MADCRDKPVERISGITSAGAANESAGGQGKSKQQVF
jgi:hypothetical protein